MLKSNLNFDDNARRCHIFEKYLTQTNNEKSCWEIADDINDFRFYHNVCQDCLIYIYSTESDELIKQQIEKILHKRKNILQQKNNGGSH